MMPMAPVLNRNSVRVLANNETYIPDTGLFSQASLTSGLNGPFRIRRCVDLIGPTGNVLVVGMSSGTYTFVLPEGDRVPTSEVVKAIRKTSPSGLGVFATPDGAIVLIDLGAVGYASFLKVTGGASTALGFTEQVGARGGVVYPGWSLENRKSLEAPLVTFQDRPAPFKYPIFNSPLKGNPDIKLTYATEGRVCPRCRGTFVENDYRFSLQGEIVLVDNENLLYQACLKALLTVKGSNPFHPAYGSSITERIGSKMVGAAMLQIQEDVRACLQNVRNVQSKQQRYQIVTDKERLYSILAVNVLPGADPTVVGVNITVQNASSDPVSLSIVFTTPGVTALRGTNGLSLGLESVGLGRSNPGRF
jgi:phage baseplate assembly protein W